MAAFRVPLLLGLSTTVTLCTGRMSQNDAETYMELMNVTLNSAVIMYQCPVATELLLACSIPLAVAFGVMTYWIGVGPAQKPNVASDSAACCCTSCCLFFVLLFPPLFAVYLGSGTTCVGHGDEFDVDAQFVDKGAKLVFVGVSLMLLTYFVYDFFPVASLRAKLKSCCSCCGEPNDGQMANMVLFMLVVVGYTILGGVGWSCIELLSASAQRGTCLAAVVLWICGLWVWWSRLYAKPTPPAVTEGDEPLLVHATPA